MALPQLLLIESLKLTVTGPQPSKAVAAPVALVVVAAPHSSVRLGGGVMAGGGGSRTGVGLWVVAAPLSSVGLGGVVMAGGVVSRTVMVCSAFEPLPQASVAVQVRKITLAPPQLLLTESLKLMLTELHVS